ncbi:alpha/beta hydrolase [Aporhodopirellula aestuarii]|uniref:Alpha/beta hydrolase n=1 Tax=Aporhodopirellula aestuarii TaxID=2950107 RepID=A0ABT0UC44_9BACT|nr:alpha/beta hydrolase [Aporhodopirellula aestuarii]MCM2373943.1 alpha/beta hydrolase [Aporhodopirellula aestuarii]
MNYLTKVMAIAAICLCTAVAAADDAKVAWTGTTFLDVTYKQVDGRQIKLDIYLPPAGNSGAVPVLYYVHGGGWAAGSKDKGGLPLMLPVFQQFAEEGFACVSINYRLCKKNSGVLMRDCVTDAMDGLRFLKKNAKRYGLDPDRIVVWGDSAGGQLAQMLTLADPDAFIGDESLADVSVRPIAGMSWYGPTDFTDVDLFKTDLSDKNPDRFGARITGSAGGYAENPEAYEEMSPYYWIKKESPPLLLIQGDTDATIPFAHASHLKTKADKIGADVTMIIVKNAGHNWRKAGGDPNPSVKEIQRMTAEFAIRQVLETRNTIK